VNFSICLKCKSEVEHSVKFCANCGYPQHGSSQEKNQYRIRKKIEANKLREIELAATVGKSVLFILGFFYLGWCFYSNFLVYDFEIFYFTIDLIEALIFLGLAFWSKKKLLAATLSGLLFFTTMFVIGIIGNPYSGILIGLKSLFFILLIVSVTSARKYEKFKKEFG